MYIKLGVGSLLSVILLLFIFKGAHTFRGGNTHMRRPLIEIKKSQGVVDLFALDADSIERCTESYIQDAQKKLDTIIAVKNADRTWKNTAYAFDRLVGASDLEIFGNVVGFLKMMSPDKAVRDAASDAVLKINHFFVDLSMHAGLYAGLTFYAQHTAPKEDLNSEQRYFIAEALKDFERAGLNKPKDIQKQIKERKKKLGDLCMEFQKNVAADQSSVIVDSSKLTGLDDDFITARKQEDGLVKLGVDYPTYFKVMQQCANADIRKKLSKVFANRAYPVNEQILKDIIAVRDEIAKLLGFSSHAAYELDNEMVGSVDRAESFLSEVLVRATKKEQEEFEAFTKELPDSVQLNADGKCNSWDAAFVVEQYKKKHYNIDQEKIAEYFPMEQTIKGLLAIYEQFLGLRLKQVDLEGLWSEDVRTLEVYDKDSDMLLGYILLDLHPRSFKYSHACAGSIVPATIHNGTQTAQVSVVLANFPKADSGDKPALFKMSDVRTFFHEFGHAIHNILGRQELASMAGTCVKRDFVEMPSQMLEEWLCDKEMLKIISGHYKTGESLPDELIDTMVAIKNLSQGSWIQRQISLAMISLDYFKDGVHKDLVELDRNARAVCCPHLAYDTDIHQYANFGHLTGYGARYYGYMWSKVFALDLFDEIKKHGLLDPVIGKRYRDLVIGRGGSKDPNELLKDFLGREPNSDAFFKDLGI